MSTSDGPPMLEVHDLTVHYGLSRVLHDVRLTVAHREATSVVGRNGVGKTTLLKAIAGLLTPTGGTIVFDGRDITRMAAHERARAGIGYIGQGKSVSEKLSVRDNIASAAPTNSRAKALRIADRILSEEFPALQPRRDVAGGGLSGGQQKLLALARVLARDPRLILLDEPTEGIQPSLVHDLGDKLGELSRGRGITVLLVEQRLDFAAGLTPRAHIMVKGRLVREVDTGELVADLDLQREYLGV